MPVKSRKFIRLSSFQIILLGFSGVILLGAALLCFPFSSSDGSWTPFIDALFTSTSAVCVTGLIVYDTALHWSLFGEIVILALIQTGGLGVVTVGALLMMLAGKKPGLFARGTMQEALAAPEVGGIVKMTGFIIRGVFIIEFVGALIMSPVFIIDYGADGIWLVVFHSISAFCNAGFDIMGDKTGAFSSLTAYSADPVINLTIMLLIVIGGIGFLVWEDVVKHKFRFSRYRTQSKLALVVTAVLIFVPALYFFIWEFEELPVGERILASLFQSVTPRTAGYNTVSLPAISDVGLYIMIALMLIGGSPGSTAGGMKTTTFAITFATAFSVFLKKDDVELFRRRLDDSTPKNATTVFMMYITLFFLAGLTISGIEKLPVTECFYEVASAIGTVGLTLGITPNLGIASKLILIALMFFGRVGGLTLIYAALGKKNKPVSKLPVDNVSVG